MISPVLYRQETLILYGTPLKKSVMKTNQIEQQLSI